MRISDDRYSRDRLRFDLALRMIGLEARTNTIRAWTGLTDDRIRKLYRSYVLAQGSAAAPRHRGKSPQQASYFTRTPRVAEQASALASLYCMLGALPSGVVRDSARTLPSVGRGDLLCHAFDCFRSQVQRPELSFEHAVYLAVALAQGDELRLSGCAGCGALVVSERVALREPLCAPCGERAAGGGAEAGRIAPNRARRGQRRW